MHVIPCKTFAFSVLDNDPNAEARFETKLICTKIGDSIGNSPQMKKQYPKIKVHCFGEIRTKTKKIGKHQMLAMRWTKEKPSRVKVVEHHI